MELILPKPGRYVVAVSGGLDSVCLLNLLASHPEFELTVAHFDHGIRPNSADDLSFVENLAKKYSLPFLSDVGQLGSNASEAEARDARYRFLRHALQQTNSDAVLTAHHQDDRLETLIINLIRGTGRRGVSSIGELVDIKRPLLKVGREELKAYAMANHLIWREDPTNDDERYLRNYIRHRVLPKMLGQDKELLVRLMNRQVELNAQIDGLTNSLIDDQTQTRLSLRMLNRFSYRESRELVAAWLRQNKLPNFNHTTIERLTVAAKTKRPGTLIDIYGLSKAKVEKDFLALYEAER